MLVMSMEMIVGMARRGMTRLTGALSIISVRSWADMDFMGIQLFSFQVGKGESVQRARKRFMLKRGSEMGAGLIAQRQ